MANATLHADKMASSHNRYSDISRMNQCQIQNWSSEEVFVYFLNLSWILTRALFDLATTYFGIILLFVIVLITMFLVYKVHFSNILFIRNLTDIGFEHVPYTKGVDRDLHIALAQKNRQLGYKIPSPYPNGWYAVAETLELKVGSVQTADALGLNFCVYRGNDGVARVVDAYCPHLGANIGIGGVVKGNCIECPFHQWTFDTEGKCIHIPDVENIPKGVSLKTWETMEVDGAVWVWYDAEGRSPLWTVKAHEGSKNWGYRGRNEFIINSHIRDIPENASDAAHLNSIHKMTFLSNVAKNRPYMNHIVGHHIWKTEWKRTDEWHTAEMNIEQSYLMLLLDIFPFKVNVKQIGPSQVRLFFNSRLGPAAIFQSITPIGPMLLKVVHRIYTPSYNSLVGAILVYGEAYQFERDVVVWNNKTHISTPPFVKTDKAVKIFRDWFSQFYSPNSVTMRDALQNPLEW